VDESRACRAEAFGGGGVRVERKLRRRRGQTALEYILIFTLLLLAAGAAYHFMHAPADVAKFTTDVICSERL